ncbi:MAG: fumarylacetoacetate hydrolase family protein [Pseudomonadota bacterium]
MALPEPAARLIRAYRQRERIAALPEDGPADFAAAYAVQREVWRELVGERRPTAWKVAAAGPEAEPLAAPMPPWHVVAGGAELPAAEFFTVGVEAEIAFRFGRDLPARAAPYGREEILDAIDAAHVAMELVDPRLADAGAAGPFWRLADNLLNGGFVLGDAIPGWRERDLAGLTVRVLAGEAVLAQTLGRPPLGDLLHCLPWWLAHAGGARAGDVVTTGAWNGMHRLALPASARVEFRAGDEPLGRVAVDVR